MRRTKIVQRTYTTKSGEVRHYTYEYSTRRNLIVSTRKGKLTKAYWDIVNQIDDPIKRAEIKGNILTYQKQYPNKKITQQALLSIAEDNRIAKMIINTGYTVEELAAELNVDAADLLNKDNWDKGTFKAHKLTMKGNKYAKETEWDFKFNYTGSILTQRGRRR